MWKYESRKWLTVSGQSKQANIHMYECNEVTLVWGTLRPTPISNNNSRMEQSWSDPYNSTLDLEFTDAPAPSSNWAA